MVVDKQLKWFYQLTNEERETYPNDRIVVGYDRAEDEYITADKVFVVRLPKPDLNQRD